MSSQGVGSWVSKAYRLGIILGVFLLMYMHPLPLLKRKGYGFNSYNLEINFQRRHDV